MKRNTTATNRESPPVNGGLGKRQRPQRESRPAVLVSHLASDKSVDRTLPSLESSTRRTDQTAAGYGERNQRPENRRTPDSRFTPRHANIVKQAVKLVCPDVSQQRQEQLAAKVSLKVRDVMDECGLDDHALITDYLTPALQAEETKFFPMPNDDDPTHIEQRNVVAWSTRTRALDMAFNLRGSYAPRAAQVELSGVVALADAVREARQRAIDVAVVEVSEVNPQAEAQLTDQT